MGGSIMQENEIIGIAGVFALTFCLIALYHLMSKFGRHSKRYRAHIKRVSERDQDRQPTRDVNKPSGKDDAWLLWSPELNGQADNIDEGSVAHRERSNPPGRSQGSI
jgi:hypothetical protein